MLGDVRPGAGLLSILPRRGPVHVLGGPSASTYRTYPGRLDRVNRYSPEYQIFALDVKSFADIETSCFHSTVR